MMKILEYYIDRFEVLMSYPIGKIFTSDTPSAKQKKHEKRCEICVEKFYGHKLFNPCRDLIRDVEASVLLFNEYLVPKQLLDSCGRLQARLEFVDKQIKNSCKSEKVLLDYYKVELQEGLFNVLLEDLLTDLSKIKEAKVPCDLTEWKTIYYSSYKDEKKQIRKEI